MLTGKRIVLTGLTGRLGGAFARALAPHNEVFGLARYSAAGSREKWEAAGVHTVGVDLAEGDFTGSPDDIDYVLHLAAWTGEGSGGHEADHAIRQNAEGSALLMDRYKDAKAFMHMSTMGVYHPEPPAAGYAEDDDVGPGPAIINYTASKLMAEGAVRALCRTLGLPTVITRVTCQYGDSGLGGIPKSFALDPLLKGEPIVVAKDGEKLRSPIHNDDVIGFIEPLLGAASVPATVVNCGGDDPVSVEMMARYMGELLGIAPTFKVHDPYPWPYGHLDPTKRKTITGPCTVPWKAGMRKLIASYYPDLKMRADV